MIRIPSTGAHHGQGLIKHPACVTPGCVMTMLRISSLVYCTQLLECTCNKIAEAFHQLLCYVRDFA